MALTMNARRFQRTHYEEHMEVCQVGAREWLAQNFELSKDLKLSKDLTLANYQIH